ncbi:MAG: LytTR family DNA-binding domain-containing protein [Bacteroidota bacterium]
MPYKCIAVDDELPALELVKNYVSQVPELQLLHSFNDAVSAGEFLRKNHIDILFVDINMPDINGIDLVSSLEEKPLIIFTTAYKKFAYEGFELEAVDYLLKPISMERFKKSVSKAIELLQLRTQPKTQPEECIFVRSEYKMVKIDLADIDYIEGLEDYIKIHIANGRPVLTLMTMKAFIEKLPADKFLRIHRSYIVSLNKIGSVGNKKVVLKNGTVLPVSDSYIDVLNKYINK